MLRAAARGAAMIGRRSVAKALSRDRPPIQASVDIAAPLAVVWSEWMQLDALIEGLHRIEEVERDGDQLVGRTAAPSEQEWRADIVDERPEEAFAWRSTEGTDCAALVTFHRLSERLTRVEADLDVLPVKPAEALLLASGLPARRAQRELRRFKARVEFINPDVYEPEQTGAEPDAETGTETGANTDVEAGTKAGTKTSGRKRTANKH